MPVNYVTYTLECLLSIFKNKACIFIMISEITTINPGARTSFQSLIPTLSRCPDQCWWAGVLRVSHTRLSHRSILRIHQLNLVLKIMIYVGKWQSHINTFQKTQCKSWLYANLKLWLSGHTSFLHCLVLMSVTTYKLRERRCSDRYVSGVRAHLCLLKEKSACLIWGIHKLAVDFCILVNCLLFQSPSISAYFQTTEDKLH